MPFSVIKNPANQNRFMVLDESGKAVAQGDYNGRSDEDIIKAASGVSAPPAKTAPQLLGTLTGNQLLNNPKVSMPAINVGQGMQGLQKGELDIKAAENKPKEIDREVMNDFRSLAQGSELSDYAKKVKDKYGIKTGPMMWLKQNLHIPGIPGTSYDNLTDNKYNNAFSAVMLNMMNPYRKLVTGAQASQQELERFIMPALPQVSDSPETWDVKNNLFKAISVYNMRLLFGMLKAQGKDVSGLEDAVKNTHMVGLDGKPMDQEDEKWTTWALGKWNDPSASESEKASAMKILNTNGFDPSQLSNMTDFAKKNPKMFSDNPDVQKTVNEADLRKAKAVFGQ